MKPSVKLTVLGVCALFVASCAPALLNDEMQQEIAAGHVKKVKLYVDADGKVVKRSLYVTPNAVPAWVSKFADDTIGKGGSEYYELEWYADSPNLKVYECTRLIKGSKVEVSVNEHQQLRYIEREIAVSDLPAAVKSAARELKGFRITEVEEKKGPAYMQYELEGMEGGTEVSYTFDPSGKLLSKHLSVPAELQSTL